MTRIAITDLDRITSALDITGAIETYIWEELDQPNSWETVGQIASQLEMASCAAGSWSGMIYTRDILDRLADPQWVQDIDDCIAEWRDDTGENPDFPDLSSMVTFAVDHTAYKLACRLRSLDHVAVVIAPSDSMDTHPDVIAFDTAWEAEDWVSDEVERRVDFRMERHAYSVTEEERDQWAEEELALMQIKEERL